MKNVTITLDERTASWARVEAAKQNVSLSRFVGEMLERRRRESSAYWAAYRAWKAIKPTALRGPGDKYPKREELYDRGRPR